MKKLVVRILFMLSAWSASPAQAFEFWGWWEFTSPSVGGVDYLPWGMELYDPDYSGNGVVDEIQVYVASSVEPAGFELTLRENAWGTTDEGLFAATNMTLMDGPHYWSTTQAILVTKEVPWYNTDPTAIDTMNDWVFAGSNTDSYGIAVSMTETGANTGVFQAVVRLNPDYSNEPANTLRVSPGDTVSFYGIADWYALSNGIVVPYTDPGIGAIEVEIGGWLSATYQGQTFLADVDFAYMPGGGAGGPKPGELTSLALGDVNIDGVVDKEDIRIAKDNKDACGVGWTSGDVTGDGCVLNEDIKAIKDIAHEG